MKAVMEFNLPEENDEFMVAVHAAQFSSCCSEIDERMRQGIKHGFGDIKTLEELAHEVREMLAPAMEHIR